MVREGWMTDTPRTVALACMALGMGACTAHAPLSTASPAASASSVQADTRGRLRIQEVRLVKTARQRGVRFQFSQPPHEIDYFPLRDPSRLVIDVKGPVVVLPQVYNTLDPLVSAVRISSYQGRMRLVIDMESEKVPPFSIDQQESVLIVYIGYEQDGDVSAVTNARGRTAHEIRRTTVLAGTLGGLSVSGNVGRWSGGSEG